MIIKNAMVAFPGENDFKRSDIRIEDGKFTAFGKDLNAASSKVLDAADYWLLPGGIDPHVHFYDPGYTAKEDFFHGTAAAAAGGVTTIIDMPSTSKPPVTCKVNLEHKLKAIKEKAHIDYALFGGVSRQLFDSDELQDSMASIAADVCAFKVYAVSGMDEIWGALDHWRFRRILEEAKALGSIVLLHAEDAEYVNNAAAHYKALGKTAQEWYNSRPELAEILAVSAALRINREVGGNLHIVHIGVAEAAKMLQSEHDSGDCGSGGDECTAAVSTGETCPQYLAFTLDDFLKQESVLKISPPVKKDGNRQQLWKLLADGTLHFIASDHAPGTAEEKKPGNIWANSAGIAGVKTILPYTFSEGYLAGRLSLPRYLDVMSGNAARRYGLFDRKGSISVGKDADMVLINSKKDNTFHAADMLSKGTVSPFEGHIFRGRVDYTFVRGKMIYKRLEGGPMHPGWGQFQRPVKIPS